MTAPTMLYIGVLVSLNFLILVLGIQGFSSSPYKNSMSFIPVNLQSTVYSKGNHDGEYSNGFCLGPFYEKSEFYRLASTLRNLGVFPKKESLEVSNFDQSFVVIGNNLYPSETELISKELSLLDISHFKVPSSEGPKIHIELAEERQVREAQLEELASLGRPWEYLTLERQSIVYFLRVHERDSGKLHHDVKENQCIGIAPLR
tara:strand:- start:3 stop:611 length:609 start_codon:yes stop_codon:yes gene_type:complete